ncbi:MAG: hypothetical protein L0220_34395, partial [Acidobacteria bacterium]|nr:hypothetical protein [Acidobacteriota bacterium]
GLMFAIFGALLLFYGLMTNGEAMYTQQSLGINVNIWWGLAMLVLGLVMLWLGRRGTATAHLAEESPEGRAIEKMEHRKGLEH